MYRNLWNNVEIYRKIWKHIGIYIKILNIIETYGNILAYFEKYKNIYKSIGKYLNICFKKIYGYIYIYIYIHIYNGVLVRWSPNCWKTLVGPPSSRCIVSAGITRILKFSASERSRFDSIPAPKVRLLATAAASLTPALQTVFIQQSNRAHQVTKIIVISHLRTFNTSLHVNMSNNHP